MIVVPRVLPKDLPYEASIDVSDHVVRLGVISFVFDLKNKANAMLETAIEHKTQHKWLLTFFTSTSWLIVIIWGEVWRVS